MHVKVEIWSDVVCPWCYIGKRRFEAALARFAHRDEVELVWRSFELDPAAGPAPAQAGGHAARLAGKLGVEPAQAQSMLDSMTATAAAEGLRFRFDLLRGGSSFDAHRLLHLAKAHGRQDQVKEALDAATFGAGLRVSDREELVAVVAAAGLDADEAREVLDSGAYAADVRADEAQAQAYGITGVPFFVVDGKYGVSGAQPADLLLQVLETAHRERAPQLVTVAGDAPVCDDESCAVQP